MYLYIPMGACVYREYMAANYNIHYLTFILYAKIRFIK